MANCSSCGAALPPDSPLCAYCRSRNDVDLKGVHAYTVETPPSPRTCPRCARPLQTLDLRLRGRFLVERCSACLGLFFDPGELDALLDASVANAEVVDLERLQNMQQLKRRDDWAVSYIQCPVCAGLMNRVNWGTRSGVIVDRCRQHGVWLDGGELRRILEWAKAGGPIHHERAQAEQERQELRLEKEQLRARAAAAAAAPDYDLAGLGAPGKRPGESGLFEQFIRSLLGWG